ncbi:MAG: zinc ribbon domain-containing protein [Gammaproteobacteria bacterium]|jgi:putative FmdB family regulatory protein
MPIYEYRCRACKKVSSLLASADDHPSSVECEHCGAQDTYRILSRVAYHQSEADKTAALDPKYRKMVDQATKGTPEADPGRLLRKMKPFDSADE